MKPPICELCHRRKDVSIVEFADFRPTPHPALDHPHGLEWFCAEHLQAAQALAHLDYHEAMAQLRARPSSSDHD
ncbi:hypothetical protein [Lysobacter capsici]|uniref:hypothetical protein n=1 Tax=Lysobacter capsici TaxID=435897 RepID=UPI001C007131|nr:hypothetical protein [Lysobacter capsici]QWF17345.1 hypothetical protein KME82_00620 [Lysobacter capsici]